MVLVGSMAAGVQSAMGVVQAGSTFATLQSAAVSSPEVMRLRGMMMTDGDRWADMVLLP